MRNFIRLTVGLVVVLVIGLPSSLALADSHPEMVEAQAVPPPTHPSAQLLLGQTQAYSATFRGNGEAIVYARLVIANPEDTPLTATSLTIPGPITDLVIYQQKLAPVCAQYSYKNETQECLRSEEPDYTQPDYYGGGPAEYKKITPQGTNGTYRVNLPLAIEPYRATALILGYASKSYVTTSLGLSHFAFETIRVSTRIQSVTVAVDVDPDVYLKGKKAAVDGGGETALRDLAPTSTTSPQLDSLVRTIGTNGMLTKTATNLASGESLIVRGQFATNWWRLYASAIIWTGLILALLGWLLAAATRRWRPLAPATISKTAVVTNPLLTSAQPIGAGFLSAVLTLFLAGITMPVLDTLNQLLGYSTTFMTIIVMIVWLLLYVCTVFGLAALVGVQHGWRAFLIAMLSQIVWYAIFFGLYLGLYQTGFGNQPPDIRPMPYLQSAVDPAE